MAEREIHLYDTKAQALGASLTLEGKSKAIYFDKEHNSWACSVTPCTAEETAAGDDPVEPPAEELDRGGMYTKKGGKRGKSKRGDK